MKEKLTKMKGKIDNSTIIIGDYSTSLLSMDWTTKQVNKVTEHFSNPINT